ncbi:MAG: SDR family NAD(P)-dependent oxidoreductase [Aeriscardovia sp.]|nr:SDR family NAD(P)-dependent oxidoreductase [Aeriscardovia sp.]
MKRTIIITGGTTGIGKATAYQFAKNGWNVVNGLIYTAQYCDTKHAIEAAAYDEKGMAVLLSESGYK